MAHLSPYVMALEQASTLYPYKVVFKVPICKTERVIEGWRNITYKEFYVMLDSVARYWLRILKLPPGHVVGLWMSGMSFSDALHIFGVMKAGYVPHILNSEITNLEVVRDIFNQTGAGAIIYTPPAPVDGLSKDFPCYLAIDTTQISLEEEEDKTVSDIKHKDEDLLLIIHTSGSTSGRPKAVRLRRKWFDANSRKRPLKQDSRDVLPRTGSFCHAGQLISILSYFLETACVVMVPWIDFSAEHIIQMYNECGLTRFIQFTPLFSRTIRYAQKNTQLLATLQSFGMIWFIGGPLSQADLEWCRINKLTLKTALASTETSMLMISGEDSSLLRLLNVEGCSYRMVPIDSEDTPQERTTIKPQLFELVVLADSLDCPDSSLCDPRDGNFHTKDLFEEVKPGEYRYRGRLDDMIKMQNARKCDTKYIEDKVYDLCGSLISACVVVGSERAGPALMVEPITTEIDDEKEFIRQIGDKVSSINGGGYPHERIAPNRILLVSPGELPRTGLKHNINRAATENKFRSQIDTLYA